MPVEQVAVLWTADDVAAYLRVSVHTVRKWRERERIPSMKVNGVVRYDPDVIRCWAAGRSAVTFD